MLYVTVMVVGLAFALAAFILRNAEWRVARVLWWLVLALTVATALLVYGLATDPALYRAFFSAGRWL